MAAGNGTPQPMKTGGPESVPTAAGTAGATAPPSSAVTEAAAENLTKAKEAELFGPLPSVWMILPFCLILALIAIMPLAPKATHFWEKNRNKLIVALCCAIPILLYYGLVHGYPVEVEEQTGVASMTDAELLAANAKYLPALNPGAQTTDVTQVSREQLAEAILRATPDSTIKAWSAQNATLGSSLKRLLTHAVFDDYIPFIVLLFALFTISGGIRLKGDIPAHPLTNTIFLALGAILASCIGTTGAAMLLIRPLLQTNSERERKVHTFVFFIFIVCNTGGLLLPIGDPPLFMGYLRGVPFFWTLRLWKAWVVVNGLLLAVYYIWDHIQYKKEPIMDIVADETHVEPMRLTGGWNFLLLAGVVFCVAKIDPHMDFLGTGWKPFVYFRELCLLALAGLSYKVVTPKGVHAAVGFNFGGICEVAALFIGIFLTMQIPIELLVRQGESLHLDTAAKLFWASGGLSSFLDNTPTYIVFFSSATGIANECALRGDSLLSLLSGGQISIPLLMAISLGSVMMGANTYIGNGPNFLVKSVAEGTGVKMPSFFGYMAYSICILIPLFIVITFLLPYLT
ncbi:MAG: sodium:proton antiporter [Planctomycetota bacterium]